MGRVISLRETFGEDAEEIKKILIMFSNRKDGTANRDAIIVSCGRRVTGAELAGAGMQQALDHAERECPDWGEMALQALKDFLKEHTGPFITEQVRNWARKIPEQKGQAWGAVISKAERLGLIKKYDWAKTINPASHSRPVIQWVAA